MKTWRATRHARPLAAHFLERHSRDERDVARDQRQHARGHEREKPGRERGKERDVLVHDMLSCRFARCRITRFPRDRQPVNRRRLRSTGEFHRRQVLEHDVPLPSLGRVRRLQPVLRRHRPRKRELARGRRSARSPAIAVARSPRTCGAARVSQRRAEREAEVDEDLPVLLRVARRVHRPRTPPGAVPCPFT